MKKLILFLAMTLCLVSCNDSYKAKSMARDFLNESLDQYDMSDFSGGRIDTTTMIKPQSIFHMRQYMSHLQQFKTDMEYVNGSDIPDTLLYIRVKYKLANKQGQEAKYSNTFYFDKGLTRVVGFTEN